MRQAARAPHDLHLMVNRRAHGEPLQYILGDLLSLPPFPICLVFFTKGHSPLARSHSSLVHRLSFLAPKRSNGLRT